MSDVPEHEYVEYQFAVENGQVVACRYFGEGRQVEPLTEPVAYVPVGGAPLSPELERIARRIVQQLLDLARKP